MKGTFQENYVMINRLLREVNRHLDLFWKRLTKT